MAYIAGYQCEFPMIWKDRTIYSTEEIGIKRPAVYGVFKHANCIGCIKAGQLHWYTVFCLFKQVYDAYADLEQSTGYTIIKGYSLNELRGKFENAKRLGFIPSDKQNGSAFWAKLKKQLKIEAETKIPCDCFDSGMGGGNGE
jgi:hypothetical protein